MKTWRRPPGLGRILLPGLFAIVGLAALPTPGRDDAHLTFEERVRAQEAIERVYYSHQIGATRPFEEAVPRAVPEAKVRLYLKQSVALEKFWNTRVTAAMLRAEVERMSRQTRMPGRLREIFAALANDPVLIQECLARPALVNRLARNFFAYDESIHAGTKRAAEAVHQGLVSGWIDPHAEHPNRTIIRHDIASDGGETAPSRNMAGLPARPGQAGPLHEEPARFVMQVLLRYEAGAAWMATYVFPKMSWDAWWGEAEAHLDEDSVEAMASRTDVVPRPGADAHVTAALAQSEPDSIATHAGVSPSACASDDTWESGSLDDFPDRRQRHTAVWAGTVMVVWGGMVTSEFTGPIFLNSGSRYDPATDTWTGISTTKAPEGRIGHAAVWTGSQMLVWGGTTATGAQGTGGRYDPTTDTWTSITTAGAPVARGRHTGVWTGSEMIVWSGSDRAGGRYDPEADNWIPVSTTNAPSARQSYSAVWTGGLMVIWGGQSLSSPFGELATGGRYDPASDTWIPTSTTNAPLGRHTHTAVWTGTRMVVWGGRGTVSNQVTHLDTGGLYDPETDTWALTSTTNAPSGRWHHSAVWTGDLMLVWGGGGPDSSGNFALFTTGGRYDPQTDTWTPTSTTDAPSGRAEQSAVWTGQHMIIWGGMVGTSVAELIIHLDTGGRYDPLTDTWTPTSRGDAPEGRSQHAAVWTGSLMVVWGGQYYDPAYGDYFPLGDGGRYDPASDTWTPTSAANAPAARSWHTATWTGDRMVIWGGVGTQYLNSGGRYDPISDTWSPTRVDGAPTPRFAHTGVWTGNDLIVWGGWDGSSYLDTGGRYDPAADTWAAVSRIYAPERRYRHTAVWTGSAMIVWGGWNGKTMLATGGRYDPLTDTWAATSLTGAPSGRLNHTVVWTGSQMIVWAGFDGASTPTGGRYHPPTDTWASVSTTDAPTSSQGQRAVWTGRHMVIWGGAPSGTSTPSNTGGRYDPASDAWAPTTKDNAPMGRYDHAAVWTGDLMIVWGGEDALSTRTGGAYCACLSAVFFRDADGDGRGDPDAWVRSCSQPEGYVTDGSDCDDGSADVWAAPREARDLLFTDDQTLVWTAPADPGATSIVYDVIRSGDPAGFESETVCITSDVMTETAADLSSPLQGELFFYLVRAENNCPGGQGSLGTDSSGTPRPGRSCP